jgi:hypothetical protein
MTLTIDTEHGRETGDAAANLRAIGARADAWLMDRGFSVERRGDVRTYKPRGCLTATPPPKPVPMVFGSRGRKPVPIYAVNSKGDKQTYGSLRNAVESFAAAGMVVYVNRIAAAMSRGWLHHGFRFERAA